MTDKSGLTLSIPLFFTEDERIDYERLDNYLQNLEGLKNVAAIYSMAFNTRYVFLDFDEVIDVNKFILQRAKELSFRCYVGHPYIFNRDSLSRYMESIAPLEPDAVSLLYPERYYGFDETILEFLQFPAQFGMKSVIHEMKLVSGFNGELIDWPLDLVKSSIALDEVIGIKEDAKNDKITETVLAECLDKGKSCILAGGGKRRALQFVEKGLTTWLNGTSLFYPKAVDKIYCAIMDDDREKVDFYCEHIESPFFEQIVGKYGWHLAHKAALQFFGFGARYERFPHAYIPEDDYLKLGSTLEKIRNNFERLMML